VSVENAKCSVHHNLAARGWHNIEDPQNSRFGKPGNRGAASGPLCKQAAARTDAQYETSAMDGHAKMLLPSSMLDRKLKVRESGGS
jgi:hypothetical protein